MSIHIDTSRTSVSSLSFIKNLNILATGVLVGSVSVLAIRIFKKIASHSKKKEKLQIFHKKSQIFDKIGDDIVFNIITYFNFSDYRTYGLLCKKTHRYCENVFDVLSKNEQIMHLELPKKIKNIPVTLESEFYKKIKKAKNFQCAQIGHLHKSFNKSKFSIKEDQLTFSCKGRVITMKIQEIYDFFPCSETACIIITGDNNISQIDYSKKEPVLKVLQNLNEHEFFVRKSIDRIDSFLIKDHILMALQISEFTHFFMSFSLKNLTSGKDLNITLLHYELPTSEDYLCHSNGIGLVVHKIKSLYEHTFIYYDFISNEGEPRLNLNWKKEFNKKK